jgi:general secretion pathway protein I
MGTRQAGFSLLEVLVAFVILALSMGVIMRLFSTSLRNIDKTDRRAVAALLAQSALATLGVDEPLSEGELTGEGTEGYRWRARVTRHIESNTVLDYEASPVRLYEIELAVADPGAHLDKPAFTLSTLRAVPKP